MLASVFFFGLTLALALSGSALPVRVATITWVGGSEASALGDPDNWDLVGEQFAITYRGASGSDAVLRHGVQSLPVLAGMEVSLYAHVIDPVTLSVAPDSTLFAGRDNTGSGGANGDAVKINRVGPGGSPVSEFGVSAILDPDAVVYDAAGIVSGIPGSVLVGGVVTGVTHGQISRIAPNGTVTSLVGSGTSVINPTKFVFAQPDRLLFTDFNKRQVTVMTNSTPEIFFAVPTSPYSLALDGLGRVLVSSSVTNQVRLHSAAGVLLSEVFVTAQPRSPLARGPGGAWGTNVYFVATNGNLRSVSPFGVVTEHGTGFAPFDDMEFGPDGALYLSDLEADLVLRITPSRLVLTIEIHPPDGVSLLWSTNDLDASLQFSTNLSTAHWRPASPLPAIVGTNYVVTETTLEVLRFYRLFKE